MAELTLEGARRVLRDKFAPWIHDLGLEFAAIAPGQVQIRLPYSERLARAGGMICGQALMAVADTGMVFAVAAKAGGFVEMATVGQTTSFFRAAPGSDLMCDIRVIRMGRTLAFGEAVLTAPDRPNDPVAKASLTYALAPPK